MNTRLNECLNGRFEKEYILPFFWQHGEPHDVLEREMDAIRASGIVEMCVESRPHEEFCRDKWWDDFGFILRYAEKHGMKVWLLDDKHFPSGYANGYLETHPELEQVTLTMVCRDVFSTGEPAHLLAPDLDEGESFVQITALRRVEKSGEPFRMSEESVSMEYDARTGFVALELPQGLWRVFYLIRSRRRHGRAHYIDMLQPESAKAMLHAVYKPHYAHFGRYFGNTFKGFFSDEPCFSNEATLWHSRLGDMQTIPWRDDLPQRMAEKTGMPVETLRGLLPALFQDVENVTARIRYAFMDVVTDLYRQNFGNMLGDWCREKGVMYIGHVIEDYGAHLGLANGCGHYFRGLDGQDMAGIDIVLHQMTPGVLENRHTAALSVGYADPKEYHYLLGKLASSHAHIDAKKKGRAMCEVFGAFGWVEGLPVMKKIADHFLCCGVNHFVPHAFSPKKDDPDCPPYFYNHGENTQFQQFGGLIAYMQRTAHMLSGGTHKADVAVVYNTGRWSSLPYQPTEDVTKHLTQNQIDFDIIPEDYLLAGCTVQEAKLKCGSETYGAVIIPYMKMMTAALREKLDAFCAAGVPVCFVDGEPECPVEQNGDFRTYQNAAVVPLSRLAGTLRKQGLAQLTIFPRYPHVRYYRTEQENGDVFMFLNEDGEQAADFTFPCKGEVLLYDACENRVYRPQAKRGRVRLRLEPMRSILVVCSCDMPEAPAYLYGDEAVWKPVEAACTVSYCRRGESVYRPLGVMAKPQAVGVETAAQAARVRYEFVLPALSGKRILLDLGGVGEISELWLNGEYLGTRFESPYRYEISGRLSGPENQLTVEVILNQVYCRKDVFSTFLSAPAPGMWGDVKILCCDV